MINQYLQVALDSIESSGEILLDYFEKLHDFHQKNQNLRDLVTEVDVLSEKNIKEKIRKSFPEHSILGEESGEEKHESEYCWHIDPLDGTVNYSQGIPLCAVSIGLEWNQEMIVGAVFNPFTEELFFASKGNGTFLNGKQIYVSQKEYIEEGLFVAAFSSGSSDQKKKEYEIFGKLNDSSRGALRIGSAALSLAYLACGRIDGMWAKGLHSWDLAGGMALVKEAGGEVSSIKGEPFMIGNSTFVASNTNIHKSFLDELNVF